jgi:hypothetical protein
VQEQVRPAVTRLRLDDDSIRVRLLLLEAVQKDLGLTDDQIGKIGAFVTISKERWREFLARSREILPPSRHFTQEESEVGDREFRALSEDWKSKDKESRTKILATLTPSQSERLKQIQIQMAIPDALARPETIKALDISEEQCGKIRTLTDRMEKKQLAEQPSLHDLNPGERRQKLIEFMKESHKIQVEATKPILNVLTPEQRAKFDKLQGRKIEVRWSDDELIPKGAEF